MAWFKLRPSEWILVGFFAYVAALVPLFPDRPQLHSQPFVVLAAVGALLCGLARAEVGRFATVFSMIRDWVPMALTLSAFREMELFLPTRYNSRFEAAWVHWDAIVLNHWGLKQSIESLGPVIPLYLELCYLLVYGVGSYCVVLLWLRTKRKGVDRFYVILLTGTLLAYALFPYFPSRPPRIAFPEMDIPSAHNVFRSINLFLLRKATIHTGVFPSAHVSSAFSAAWAMLLVLPQHKRIGWGLVAYATSVSVATVYGRYHYTADVLAGFAVSLIAGFICLALRERSHARVNDSRVSAAGRV